MNSPFSMQYLHVPILAVLLMTLHGNCLGQLDAPSFETFDGPVDTVPAGWNVVAGEWRVTDGALQVDALTSEAYVTFGESTWENYQVEASVTFHRVRDPSRWLSILIRATRNGDAPWSQVPVRFDTTQPNGVELTVRTPDHGWSIRKKAASAMATERNQSRRLRVIVRGSHVEAFLDNQKVINSDLCVDRASGCVGLGASGCIAAFDDVTVRHLAPSPKTAVAHPLPCDIVAHRGYSAVAPENTLSAIRRAIQVGATGCEFDVYGCRDGHVVLMHDKTVDRTTNGAGPVTELSLDQLRQLDAGSWKHAQYAGEHVPTLIEALELLKGTNCQPVIEIKMEGISRLVVNDVRKLDMVDQVAVIAFSQDVVREIRELEPRITCAWLCGETPEGTVAQQADWLAARARECKAKVLDLNFTILSPGLVEELKQRELGIWTWTVNETQVMGALQQWGVNSITTDHPERLVEVSRSKDHAQQQLRH